MSSEKKYVFGTVKVGERGQIVIPKDARKMFDINPGDTLAVLGAEQHGIALAKVTDYDAFMKALTMNSKGGEDK